jgi:uncharacterized membrane protein YtjA (UPF0391 family)
VTAIVVALIAALFGFGGIASAAAGIAKVLFFIAISIFAVMVLLTLSALTRRAGEAP